MKLLLWGALAITFITGCTPTTTTEKQENKTEGGRGSTCQNDVLQSVDPFWGVEAGNTFPGACVPFGMLRAGADSELPMPTSGYTSHRNIVGFSQTHLSGTGGGGRYGSILLTPNVGDVNLEERHSLKRTNEYAAPGFYGVTLHRIPGDVRTKVTTLERVAMYEFEYNTWDKSESFEANLMIDLGHMVSRTPKESAVGGDIRMESPTMATGYGKYKDGWGGENPYTVYFALETNKPSKSVGTWMDGQIEDGVAQKEGKFVGGFFRYDMAQHEVVVVKIGISFKSVEQAKKNLSSMESWDFATVRGQAEQKWASIMGNVAVEGGSPELRKMFYSGIYHTLIMPTDLTGENPLWESGKPHFWEHYCLWDVFRNVMPLYTLLYPEKQRDIVNSLIDIYEHKGWLPDAWIAGDYADVQGGSSADIVLADAISKDLAGIDKEKAYEAMLKNSREVSDNPLKYGRKSGFYNEKGYSPDSVYRCVSRTVEYAYCDYAVASVAKALGKPEAEELLGRSKGVFELFHPERKMFLAKNTAGEWNMDAQPEVKQKEHYGTAPFFYEGDAWIYSSYVPHAMADLIERHGSPEAFVSFLDEVFEGNHFAMGNEPGFLTPYQYNYAGRPDKTAFRVRELLAKHYMPGRKGLPGQDDSGAMSGWMAWSAMGLYPVAGQPVYLIGAPHFKKVSLALSGGDFIIEANGVSGKHIYIQSATLNGKPHNRSWLTHEELVSGGHLVLEMGSEPSDWGKSELPPSY